MWTRLKSILCAVFFFGAILLATYLMIVYGACIGADDDLHI